jgi:hypothetical protein
MLNEWNMRFILNSVVQDVTVFFEPDNKSSHSVSIGNFLDQLIDNQSLMKSSDT